MKRNNLTPAEKQTIADLYPTTHVEEIARQLRCSKITVYKVADALGIKKPPHSRSSPKAMQCRARLLELAARPKGVATNEIPEFSVPMVGMIAARMLNEGLLFRGRISYKSVRFFCDEKTAEAFQRGIVRSAKPTLTIATHRGPAYLEGPLITTAKTRHVVYPSMPRVLRTNTHSVY